MITEICLCFFAYYMCAFVKLNLEGAPCNCYVNLPLRARIETLNESWASVKRYPDPINVGFWFMSIGLVVGWPFGVVVRIPGDIFFWVRHTCDDGL